MLLLSLSTRVALRNVVSSYRPISLLPVASKIPKRTVRDQVYSHPSTNHLLSPCQSGFAQATQRRHLTVCHQRMLLALDKCLFVGGVFLDISKAFDTINHDLPLSCLSKLGKGLQPISERVEIHYHVYI